MTYDSPLRGVAIQLIVSDPCLVVVVARGFCGWLVLTEI
jgi:hypothetical protein